MPSQDSGATASSVLSASTLICTVMRVPDALTAGTGRDFSPLFLRGRQRLDGDGQKRREDAVAQIGEIARARREVLVARRSILRDLRLQRRTEGPRGGLALFDRLERRLQQGRVAEELDLEFDDLRSDGAARCLETLELQCRLLHGRLEELPLGYRLRRPRAIEAVEMRQGATD